MKAAIFTSTLVLLIEIAATSQVQEIVRYTAEGCADKGRETS